MRKAKAEVPDLSPGPDIEGLMGQHSQGCHYCKHYRQILEREREWLKRERESSGKLLNIIETMQQRNSIFDVP